MKLTVEELKILKQKVATARQKALGQRNYSHLDSLHELHQPLRELYGPDIIEKLERL
jgi:hypothetical protein